MKRAIGLMAILALALAVGCDDGDTEPGADMMMGGGGEGGGSDIDGEAAFATQCAACHSTDGSGVENLGPDIRNPANYGYATYVVRNGRDEMDEFAGAMLAFNESALDQPTLDAMLDFLSDAAKPADGAGLYARFCANCHDADGSGGFAAHPIAGIDEATIRDHVRNGNGGDDYGATTAYMPAFATDLITDAELDLIVTHVTGL